ncbi:MAG TPA: hypothetical protein GX709_04950 [Clostridiales bacterium]|nr:hypothetical protein [Clostridiales bacterium]
MKSNVKKFYSFIIVMMMVVFAVVIFISSSQIAKAEEGEKPSITIPETLRKKIVYKVDEDKLIEQPLADDESFNFKIGKKEYTVQRGVHFKIDESEGNVWQYKSLKGATFSPLEKENETNNFKKPGVYKSPKITLIEGATIDVDGVKTKLKNPTEGKVYIEYIIGLPIGELEAYTAETAKRSFNNRSQPLNAAYTFNDAVKTTFDGEKYSPTLGTDITIHISDNEWMFRKTEEDQEKKLDTVENNFVRSGIYTIKFEAKETSYYVSSDDSIIKYEIHKADATSFVNHDGNEYYAIGIEGLKLGKTQAVKKNSISDFLGKWEMVETEPVDAIIDHTNVVDELSSTTYEFKFTPDEGYEDEYTNYNNIKVHIKVSAKPEVIFVKHDLTSQQLTDAEIQYTEGEEKKAKFKIPAPGILKSGYTFKGWLLKDGAKDEEGEDILYIENEEKEFELEARYIFTQFWEANTDTKFILKYLFESIAVDENGNPILDEDGNIIYREGLGPTAFPNETLTGTTDATIKTPEEIEPYEFGNEEKYKLLGFVFNQDKTLADEDNKNFKIKGDGKASYKLYFNRKVFSFVFEAKEGDGILEEALPAEIPNIKFGAKQKLPVEELAKKGYIFNGYKDGLQKTNTGEYRIFKSGEEYVFNEVSDDIHNNGKVTFTANFSPRKDVPYIVYHKLVDDSDIKDPDIVKTGETDKKVFAIYSMVGYKKTESPDPENKKDTETILATDIESDATIEKLEASHEIIKLYCYYEKVKGTYAFGKTGTPTNIEYGEQITLPKAPESTDNRVFKGWQIDGGTTPYSAGDEITYRGGNLVFLPIWASPVQSETTEDDSFDNSFLYTKEKEGLSGGAIAGIVIASLVVAAIVLFSIIWFGVQKKTFKDLAPKKSSTKSKGKRKGGFLK